MLAEIRTPGWIAVLLALAIFGGAIAIALRSYVNHRRHAADSANWRPGAGSGPKRHDAIQHIGGVGLLEPERTNLERFISRLERLGEAIGRRASVERSDGDALDGSWSELESILNTVIERYEQLNLTTSIESRIAGSVIDLTVSALRDAQIDKWLHDAARLIVSSGAATAVEIFDVGSDNSTTLRTTVGIVQATARPSIRITVEDLSALDAFTQVAFDPCQGFEVLPIRAASIPIGYLLIWEPSPSEPHRRLLADIRRSVDALRERITMPQATGPVTLGTRQSDLPGPQDMRRLLDAELGRGRSGVEAVLTEIRLSPSDNSKFHDADQDESTMRSASAFVRASFPSPAQVFDLGEGRFGVVFIGAGVNSDLINEIEMSVKYLADECNIALGLVARCGAASSRNIDSPSTRLIRLAASQAAHSAVVSGITFVDGSTRHHAGLNSDFRLSSLLRSDIKRGLDGPFTVEVQPICAADTGGATCVEALARWTRPELRSSKPFTFISLAENLGLIDELGATITRLSMREMVRYGHADVRLSINASAREFQHRGLAQRIETIATEENYPIGNVEIELTETAIVSDDDGLVLEQMNYLSNLGVTIAVDDFGTGFASFQYLTRFPVDKLKIDRVFVTNIHQRRDARTVVDNIARLAHELGMSVVAEGVETIDELGAVIDAGCDLIQGFAFSRPIPVHALEEELVRLRLAGPALLAAARHSNEHQAQSSTSMADAEAAPLSG